MSAILTHKSMALGIVAICFLAQFGFALGIFGPTWLSPILSLPALFAFIWLWRRAEKQNQTTQAFARLVI